MPAFILCIETSNTNCSACITDGEKIVGLKEENKGYTHAENLHILIQEVLQQSNIPTNQLNAIAVSKGPGSYTGLRIGVSAAKGLCYVLGIPLIAIDTLQSMAWAAYQTMEKDILFCPLVDARRMEVYCAMFDKKDNCILKPQSLILDEKSIIVFKKDKPVCFFGDGMPKAKELLQQAGHTLFLDDIYPSSKYMVELANRKYKQKAFEDTAYFEPHYVKDFYTPVKSK